MTTLAEIESRALRNVLRQSQALATGAGAAGGNQSNSVVIATDTDDMRTQGDWAAAIVGMEDAAEKGVAVASASTITLGSGRVFHITGSTGPVTDIDFADPADGRWAILVFDSTPTLTHSSTLSINGATDFTAAADDRAIIFQDNGDTMYVLPFRKSGKAIVPPTYGEVSGKPTSTDNAIARFDSTAGLLQNSAAIVDDTTGRITAGSFRSVAPFSTADDGVTTFTLSSYITSQSAYIHALLLDSQGGSIGGLMWLHATGTVAPSAGPGFVTGGVVQFFNTSLSGTTQTDAKLNIGAAGGVLYVENRLGSARTFQLVFFGG